MNIKLTQLLAMTVLLFYIPVEAASAANGTIVMKNGTMILANGTIINATNSTNVTVRAEASYPADLLTHEQIRKGGFLIYIFGKVEVFVSYPFYSYVLLLLRYLSRYTEFH